MKNLYLVILLLVTSGLIQSKTKAQQNAQLRPDPVVATEIQQGSPLAITPKPHWFDEQTFEIYVVVKNISDKRITAYATATFNLSQPNSQRACFMHSFAGPGKMLLPDKSDGKSQWNRTDNNNKIPNLEFGVDFVEFSDGSTWGTDRCQMKEYLDGYRSGLRAARELFKKAVPEVGGEQLIAELSKGPVEIEVPQGHSARWITSFKSGVEGMRSSVLRAYQERGVPEIKIELSRPIDASENPEEK
ncbi:MAG TPA: hypothetical protein VGO56_01615 [Pyrinomonadaceae bacterium]|jgi:hypothetical protein|nr:hypothetical protein [Pyrinomonadaceae bacterium]